MNSTEKYILRNAELLQPQPSSAADGPVYMYSQSQANPSINHVRSKTPTITRTKESEPFLNFNSNSSVDQPHIYIEN